MNSRREQAEANYREKFEQLNLDGFEFIRREWSSEHDKRFWVRCKRCGRELLKNNDILRGKTKRLECRECGNGIECRSDFADEVLAYYTDKHTMKETCEKYGITKTKLSEWVKARGISNGRTQSEINAENAKAAAEKNIKQAENNLSIELLTHGFGYLHGYERKGSQITVIHFDCGGTFAHRSEWFKANNYKCSICEAKKAEEKRNEAKHREELEKIERQKEKEQREALRALLNPLGLSPYQLEREKRLDEMHVCKICGNNYNLRDYLENTGHKYARDEGYCSAECERKGIRQRKRIYRKKTGNRDNHRARARRYGCEYDPSVTLKRVVERFGLTCAICGELCDWNDRSWTKYCGPLYPSIDHIIPMVKKGGHTWDNVQVAHIQCNSEKGASITYLITEDGSHGSEENNDKTEVENIDNEVG